MNGHTEPNDPDDTPDPDASTTTPADASGPAAPTPADVVHVQLLLDRSGSMESIAAATIDAINGFLAKQRAHPGMLRLSLADFDSREPFRLVVDAVPVAEVVDLTGDDFEPRGGTPLLDAIGLAVERIDARVGAWPDEDQVLVVITDGHENASTDRSPADIAALLEARQEAGWTVLFLGANQDSVTTGGALQMKQGNVRDFEASDAGMYAALDQTSVALLNHRSRGREERRQHKDVLFDEVDDNGGPDGPTQR